MLRVEFPISDAVYLVPVAAEAAEAAVTAVATVVTNYWADKGSLSRLLSSIELLLWLLTSLSAMVCRSWLLMFLKSDGAF